MFVSSCSSVTQPVTPVANCSFDGQHWRTNRVDSRRWLCYPVTAYFLPIKIQHLNTLAVVAETAPYRSALFALQLLFLLPFFPAQPPHLATSIINTKRTNVAYFFSFLAHLCPLLTAHSIVRWRHCSLSRQQQTQRRAMRQRHKWRLTTVPRNLLPLSLRRLVLGEDGGLAATFPFGTTPSYRDTTAASFFCRCFKSRVLIRGSPFSGSDLGGLSIDCQLALVNTEASLHHTRTS